MVETLDFIKNKVQAVDLETLETSISEKFPNGQPMGEIFHFEAIKRLLGILAASGFNPMILDMFAANNRDRYRPGVTIDNDKAREFGLGSPKCHILRRVFCNITMQPMLDEQGITMNAAISYSQRGVTIAFGSHVAYCRNLHLLGAEAFFSNYSTGYSVNDCNNLPNIEVLFEHVQDYVHCIMPCIDREMEFITTAMKFEHDPTMMPMLWEKLANARICHDTDFKGIRTSKAYPLNSAQLNAAMERYYIEKYQADKAGDTITWWGIYNILNRDLNCKSTEMPSILPQSAALSDLFRGVIGDFYH